MRGNVTWTPQRLAWSSLLMAMGEQPTLVERFAAVRECLEDACPHWQLGTSYEGWVDALRRESDRLVPLVIDKLRRQMRELTEHQQVAGWEVYAVDGSDGVCPRTKAHQEVTSHKGQPEGMPLLSMTVLYHVALEMPWSFRVGPSTESERGQLYEMLDDLPTGSLLVADAGFVGYDCCRQMIEKQQHFLLRVGGNVHLPRELGYSYDVDGETVYLWPDDQQKQREPPLRPRLILVQDEGKQPIYLVTNVLDSERLPLAASREIYYSRWGIEVFYRGTKQTLGHDGVLSRTPNNGYLEMTWALLGEWFWKLLTIRQQAAPEKATKASPRKASLALIRNLLRRAIRNARPARRVTFREALATCRRDDYHRTKPKASRNYPRKKRHRTPKPPKIKSATTAQRELAKELTPLTIAN